MTPSQVRYQAAPRSDTSEGVWQRITAFGAASVAPWYAVGMALNKLRFHNILVGDMGAPSAAAEELADVVDAASSDAATKADLAAAEARLGEQVWRVGFYLAGLLVAIGGILIGLLVAFGGG